jgi:dTDP-4-dehydrorhamnose reductase
MPRLLITGASGFLGWQLAQAAGEAWQVFGTYHQVKRAIVQERFGFMQAGRIDLTDFSDMREMMRIIRPDAVIHTAALSQPNACQERPDLSFRINVDAARNLAGLCADREIPFVFTSTDLVFDGTAAPYAEDAPVKPVSIYGEHKAQAEVEILDRHPSAAICRMPLMFGPASPTHTNFLQWMEETLAQGGTLSLFHDEYRTPVSSRVAAQGLLMVARSHLPEAEEEGVSPIRGRLHLGGRERISRYGFGLLVQESRGLGQGRIQPVSAQSVEMAAPRPPDVSLDSRKAYELGYNPPKLAEQLQAM